MDDIDTLNLYGVAIGGNGVYMLQPPRGPMSGDQALTLAAWLVVLADGGERRFQEILTALKST